MQIVILKTDFLFFLLLAGIFLYSLFVFKDKQLLDVWRQVFRKPLAIASGMVLFFYLAICLLDSIHFKHLANTEKSQEITSVLDSLFDPISKQVETTYSAPFAYSSFVKETILNDDGSVAREFPRLKFGGSHLIDPESDYWPDIWISLIYILCMGFVFWLVLLFIYYFFFSYRSRPKSVISFVNVVLVSSGSFKVFWVALLGFCLLFSFLFVFAGHYHILGTDKVGNDVLYQSFKSIRTGVLIGTLTTLLALPFALIFGVTAGYFWWMDR